MKRGEVWLTRSPLGTSRHVVIVGTDMLNQNDPPMILCAYITTRDLPPSAFVVPLKPEEDGAAGAVLATDVGALSSQRFENRVSQLSELAMLRVEKALRAAFQL